MLRAVEYVGKQFDKFDKTKKAALQNRLWIRGAPCGGEPIDAASLWKGAAFLRPLQRCQARLREVPSSFVGWVLLVYWSKVKNGLINVAHHWAKVAYLVD